MQVMANVMSRPIRIHRSEQTCALGAAMFAATVALAARNIQQGRNSYHVWDIVFSAVVIGRVVFVMISFSG